MNKHIHNWIQVACKSEGLVTISALECECGMQCTRRSRRAEFGGDRIYEDTLTDVDGTFERKTYRVPA